MTPLVSPSCRYVLYYSPKCACTYLRHLFSVLHMEEFSGEGREQYARALDNRQPYPHIPINFDAERDYSTYSRFIVVRDPFTRAVSCFLDRVVSVGSESLIRQIVETTRSQPDQISFQRFLDYLLAAAKDGFADTDFHAVPQSVPYPEFVVPTFAADQIIKLEDGLEQQLSTCYAGLFSSNTSALARLADFFSQDHESKRNRTAFDESVRSHADTLSLSELRELHFPSPVSFLSPESFSKVLAIYREDFDLFGYAPSGDAVRFSGVKQLPPDFNWERYARLHPDLKKAFGDNRHLYERHYLNFGIPERRPYR